MIKKIGTGYVLSTKRTTYCFNVTDTGHLEHVHYGAFIDIDSQDDLLPLIEKHAFIQGNLNEYDKEHTNISLEDISLEMSSYGKGDIREPFIEMVHADGSSTCDFVFDSYVIDDKKDDMGDLPGSYVDVEEAKNKSDNDSDNCSDKQRAKMGVYEHLKIILKDVHYNQRLELNYYVYADCDVITRNAKLINESEDVVKLNRLMSTQLDLPQKGYKFTTFNGAWAREMGRTDTIVSAGKLSNSSYTGTSSSRANPFVMISIDDDYRKTDEFSGECYGMNLIYSGNHYEALEVSSFGKTRFVTGINPTGFEYIIAPSECFISPEAVMTWSDGGYNGMSVNMHKFVREHIVRGKWKNKPRPILLNSWEACYFDINERKLLGLAKEAKALGMELFVMDDGWFGKRNDDTSSLGDWFVNEKKLPGGLSKLAGKINDMGLMFGIWIEPEMVNVKSKLYEAHPEWVLDIPGHPHSEGRHQRILDLGNEEVRKYIIEKMSDVFLSANISYVKWDMNRTFTDYFSKNLPANRQGEVAHRYVLGLYKCMKTLTERFPDILFEGCSAGGNRFDLGILCYFPQIWASDNTDALCRVNIQHSYSYGYPQSVVSAHVSGCPNHQTLRITPLETRFNVASFGVLGYEVNLNDLNGTSKEAVKAQIEAYKEWRDIFFFGQMYRGRHDNITEWTCVSVDKKKAVGMIFQELVEANSPTEYYKAVGLDDTLRYHFYNRELKYSVKLFGDLVNLVSPIHVKPDSFVHNMIDKFVKMDGEVEDYKVRGDILCKSGIKLKQGFGATGYSEEVRYFQDFASRMYFMEGLE